MQRPPDELLDTSTAPENCRIQIILGSTREGRFGDRVANWFYGLAAEREDLIAELIDLRDWPLPFFNEPTSPITGHYAPEARAWAARVAEGDGYVFVTPEYNFGYPAVLKNALDHLYHEWNNKPVAFVSYGGTAGGSRAVQQLREVVVELQMAPIRAGIVIPFARRLFDENGEIKDESYNARANALLDQLLWWARALKAARAGDPSAS
jgi:NAD(P)H-dependent FMN reductase